MSEEKKNRYTGIIGTIVFHAGVLLLLCFLALRTALPLPGEEGVLVNLGYDDQGIGTEQQQLPSSVERIPERTIKQNSEEKEYLTQNTEEAPSIEKKKKEDKKKEPEKVKPKPEPEPDVHQEIKEVEPQPEPEPQVDQRAMYKGKGSSGDTGGQEGITGQPGDQGDPSGTPGASVYQGKNGSGLGEGTGSGTGTGQGDGSGDGVSFKLEGRGSLVLYRPSYESKEQGKVIVTIKVDRSGKVISAVSGAKGTNVSDQKLWQVAKDAALRSTFKPDPAAPEFQIGTITYNFIRQN